MEDISQLSGLTKLHLRKAFRHGCEGSSGENRISLRPRASVTMLQELGLYTHDHLDSCDAFLCSSMQSLRHINLLAA